MAYHYDSPLADYETLKLFGQITLKNRYRIFSRKGDVITVESLPQTNEIYLWYSKEDDITYLCYQVCAN
jgi:hypothetical protein